LKYFKTVKSHRLTLAIAGMLSLLWFIYRTGTKPTRIRYPCQRAALVQIQTSFVLIIAPFFSALTSYLSSKKKALLLIPLISLGAIVTIPTIHLSDRVDVSNQSAVLDLQPRLATANSSVSDVFFINNASGPEGNLDFAMQKLIDLMESRSSFFYSTSENPSGLFRKDDVIIIKISCQSDRRGGTNTDLLKSLIQKIVDHPDGFDGEIVVADNGQGIGWLDWYETNSFDRRQSAQDVVDHFSSSYKVSTYLWDTIRKVVVSEYDSGDLNDGYVVDPEPDPATSMRVSYPKFRTAFGTYISMRKGVWNVGASTYHSAKLKVINMQVLKSHELYGVTGCVKNYMGVLSQFLSDGHHLIGKGAMGTEMAKTRFPTLNILDCIWVNANPIESGKSAPPVGPVTPYEDASYTNVIAASVDPVALDYLASKYVLMPAAFAKGYKEVSSLDPDNSERVAGLWESFHNYLKRSMEQLKLAGFQVTMNETEMNMFVDEYFPKIHQGNLVITSDYVTTIEGRFDINGSIIVEENATLYLKNAVINFRQMANGQHNMTFRNTLRGKPHLRVENATIATSKYFLPVYFYSSSATIVELNATNFVELRSHGSNVSISGSRLDSLYVWGSSIVTLSNSIVRNLCSELSDVTVSNCTIGWLSGLDSNKVKALNSTIKDELKLRGQCVVWLMNSTSTHYNLSGGGAIYIYWYLNVHAVDSEGTDVSYANVTAIFPNATVAESELADAQGWAKLTLMERLMTASGSHPVGNYTVTAKYKTYEGQKSVNITGNQQITIILSYSQRIKPEPFPILLPLLLALITIVIAVALRKLLRSHSQRY